MTIEAMKQWLEALELMYACYAHPEWISHKQQEEKILAQCVATTMTLRQAIAEAEKQEPVGWVEKDGDLIWNNKEAAIGRNLYTHPQPKREWVGLTPEERLIIIDQWHWDEGKTDYLCRLVEEKLKEKNT